jgi:serine/threonine protein phosphatase 1
MFAARVAASERVYAVGDIHGRIDLLERMLALIAADSAACSDGRRPRLVFLGDYIDRGDESRAVLARLAAAAHEHDNGCKGEVLCLAGNHEAALLGFLRDPAANARWLRYGGLQTLAAYGVATPDEADAAGLAAAAAALAAALGPHLDFVRDLRMTARSGTVLFAHAGLDPDAPPGAPPESQGAAALLWGRSAFLERGGPAGFGVVHGHYDAPEPRIAPRRICVDTGAYHSGRLSAVRLDAGVAILTAEAATARRVAALA